MFIKFTCRQLKNKLQRNLKLKKRYFNIFGSFRRRSIYSKGFDLFHIRLFYLFILKPRLIAHDEASFDS